MACQAPAGAVSRGDVDTESTQHAEEFADMALLLHDVGSFEETVERVLEFAVKTLHAAYAGIVIVHDGSRVETVAATHPVVSDLDRIQLECGQGPDLDEVADRQGVLIRDVTRETRWPHWARRVATTGVRSMLGTRLQTTSAVIGSLNVYDVEVDKFSQEDVDVAHLLAPHAAIAMDSARESETLWQAIDARNLIGQAQGILMERFSVDADQAFAVLRRFSQDHNLKLHVVAQRLIDTGVLPRD